jgi:hypothetical protein
MWLQWAKDHGATAFFAGVGLACVNYPDKSAVTRELDHCRPIRNAGFWIAYKGLQVMTTTEAVKIWGGGH